jgi:membrane-associated phospholipid phosphatase
MINYRGENCCWGEAMKRIERAARPAIIMATALYFILAAMVRQRAYFDWDLKLARAIQSLSLPGFRTAMIWLSELGSGYLAVALVLGIGAALFFGGRRLEAAICAAGAGAGGALNMLLKLIVDRPRPSRDLVAVLCQYDQGSFPSGHVVFSVGLFGFLLFLSCALIQSRLARGAIVAAMLVAILLMGISRIYVGAHWPSDVAGAYLFGAAWLALMIKTYLWLKRQRQAVQIPPR